MNIIDKERHGGPFDRGRADSYYRRPRRPHFFLGASYSTPEVVEREMTVREIDLYNAGYTENQLDGEHKDYSDL